MNTKVYKIVIWGAGIIGKTVLEEINRMGACVEVVAFGDNDSAKHGTKYCDYPVWTIEDLKKREEEIDYVLIASNSEKEIEAQLEQIIKLPHIRNTSLIWQRASVDITGWCNAKCKWCATGSKNRNCSAEHKYMDLEEFKIVYEKLRELDVLLPFNELLLYSWGEPFLNPDYMAILDYLHEHGQRFSISTNASILKYADKDVYQYCDTVVFSLSGFSQESYGRIHGFDLERTKKNIALLIEDMRDHGFKGNAKISFHVYKYNQDEVKDVQKFADSLGIEVAPIIAYFASYGMVKDYLKGELDAAILREANEELILGHVEELLKKRPKNFRCAVEQMISINCEGFIELCCCCDSSADDYKWDKITFLKDYKEWQEYRKKMLSCSTCNECRMLGIDYWFFNNPDYEEGEY